MLARLVFPTTVNAIWETLHLCTADRTVYHTPTRITRVRGKTLTGVVDGAFVITGVVTFFLRAPDGTISQTFTLITVISLVKHSALHVELIVVSTVWITREVSTGKCSIVQTGTVVTTVPTPELTTGRVKLAVMLAVWQTGVLITADVSCVHTCTSVAAVALREGAP